MKVGFISKSHEFAQKMCRFALSLLCSLGVLELCFYSEDWKQDTQSRASSVLSSDLALIHYFSLQYKQAEEKGQNEDRENESSKR